MSKIVEFYAFWCDGGDDRFGSSSSVSESTSERQLVLRLRKLGGAPPITQCATSGHSKRFGLSRGRLPFTVTWLDWPFGKCSFV